jgi:hypothetical protein
VRFAAHKVGVYRFEDYLVLGDDIIIAGEKVALAYKDLIEKIGIKISLNKSVVPGPNGKVRCEFASRLIVENTDYSPFPVGLIVLKDLASRISLMTNLVERLLTNSASIESNPQKRLIEIIIKSVFPTH